MHPSEFERFVGFLLATETRWYLYVLLGGLAFALVWRVAAAPRRRTVVDPPLTAPELGCLRYRRAPVVVALAELRAGDHVDSAGQVTGRPLPPDADPFVRAVHARCAGLASYTVRDLDAALSGELDALENRVAARGYLRSHADRRRMRVGAAPLTVAALGGTVAAFVRLVLLRGPEYAWLGGTALLGSFTTVVATPFLWTVSRTTPAGRQLLRAERERLRHLAPSHEPAWAAYGAAAVGFSVAAFGTTALWRFDGAFAESIEAAGGAEDSDGSVSCGAGCGGGPADSGR